jgi:hypothetical protein
MKVIISTDGSYGDRAYNTIKEIFDTDFIKMEAQLICFLMMKLKFQKNNQIA